MELKISARQIIRNILVYLYIIFFYSYIIYNFSFYVRITNKLEGWAMLVGETLLYIIVFIIVNHVIVKRVLSTKTLIIIEVLLILTVVTLIGSDLMYDECMHLKYLQSL